jgi:cell division protein FtsL
MTRPINDEQVQARIEELEREERRLRSDEQTAADTARTEQVAVDARRLEEVRLELDRLWDYLRQRRARREAGRDPDDAQMRDAGTVERYLG